MNPRDDSLDPCLQNAFDQLKTFPPRNAQAAARVRARFLAEAESLRQGVPAHSFWRHIGWINLFPRKERFSMGTLAIVLLMVALVFGGSGATVYAAQDALPTDPLYPVKILSEDMRVNLTGDAEARANLLLEFSSRRAAELAALGAKGTTPADPVIARQQEQIQNVLQIAAGLDDPSMNRLLTRTRENLQQQLQVAEQSQSQFADAAPTWARVREMLAAQCALAQMGVENQFAFRERVREWNGRVPPLPTGVPPIPPTIPITATVRPRPTMPPLPTVPVTLTLQPRPTRVPPTIPPTLTISPGPTDWQRPTLPVTATIRPCLPWPPNWPTPSTPPTVSIPICPWPTNVPTPDWTPPGPPSNWTPPAPPPNLTPPAPPSDWMPPAPPPNSMPPAPPANSTPPGPQPNRTPGPPR